LYLVVF